MRIAWLAVLGWLMAIAPAGAGDVVLVSEFSGKLLFLDGEAADPRDAVVAAVLLTRGAARTVAATPDGSLAFVGHDIQAGSAWLSVVDVAAVLNDTNPANDVIATIAIPTTPSLAGHNVGGISELHASPGNSRLAIAANIVAGDVFANGIVYLMDIDSGSGNFLQIIDFQRLNPTAGTGGGALLHPAFNPAGTELWLPNGLGIGTGGAQPGIHVRSATDLSDFVPARNIANFGLSEAFSAPAGVRFNAAGSFAVAPQAFNGYLHVFNASTRAIAASQKFGTATPGGCAAYGTSFPWSAEFSADGTKLFASLGGGRPFNFGCGPLTTAVHGVGFMDWNGTALSNVGTLALDPATEGSLRIFADVRFSFSDPDFALVLTTRGVHDIDVVNRAKGDFFQMGICPGEGFLDLDNVSATIGAPRFIPDYRDFDQDGLADARCDAAAPVDWGDAPDPTYPTLNGSDGASHRLSGLFLGASVDAETDGQPNAGATGDDANATDDEDGVTFTSAIFPGGSADLDVVASASGLLDAWVDWNANGSWGDAGEQLFASQALSAGTNALSIAVPASAVLGPTFARFRVSSAGGLAPDDAATAADGEVEDHAVTLTTPPTPEISIDDVLVTEPDFGPRRASFTVTLSNMSASSVSVEFRTQDVTAIAGGVDYLARTGLLTFDPGVTRLTLNVTVCADLLFEGDETFNVRLRNPVGAVILDDTGVGTIVDNDPVPVVSISDISLLEGTGGMGEAVFVVKLSSPSASTIEVGFATADGTARRGRDYEKTVGHLTFKPGKLDKKIRVPIYRDGKPEPDESFVVNLSGIPPAQGFSVAPSQGVATLMNDDH